MTINVNDTAFKESAEIEIILDSGATGMLIVKVGNITQTKHAEPWLDIKKFLYRLPQLFYIKLNLKGLKHG